MSHVLPVPILHSADWRSPPEGMQGTRQEGRGDVNREFGAAERERWAFLVIFPFCYQFRTLRKSQMSAKRGMTTKQPRASDR